MTETYFGIALAVLIVFGIYKYIQNRKSRKNVKPAPPMSDPLPPLEGTPNGGVVGEKLPPKQEK